MSGTSHLFSPESLLQQLRDLPIPDGGCYRVAYSGGLDSSVLLHVMAAVAGQLTAPIAAVHVDHGLSSHSANWSAQCAEICRSLGVSIDIRKVTASPVPGESPEAAAREARYGAIRELMSAGDVLVMAHHQDDQAETVLLRLLRGAGPRGAAAMRPAVRFGGGWLIRPLLGVSREALRPYAEQAGLDWIDDPSNFDTVFDRNFLRRRVLPALKERWPAAGRLLARSASHFDEASQLLAELAEGDLAGCGGTQPGTLSVHALQGLTGRRIRNLIRYWLEGRGLTSPDTVHLQRVLDEVLPARPDAQPEVAWPGGRVRRYRDDLHALAALPAIPSTGLTWRGNGPLELPPGLGRLRAEPSVGSGIRQGAFREGDVEVRFRAGGERCRPASRGVTRPVKKLMQEFGVPPWERERTPLLYIAGELAAIAGICTCEPFAAGPGEAGFLLHWERSH